MKKISVKIFTAVCLVMVVLMSLMGCMQSFPNKTTITNQDTGTTTTSNTQEYTQTINNADPFIEFALDCSARSKKEAERYFSVTNLSGTKEDVSLRKDGDKWIVAAPKSGYSIDTLHKIKLNNAKFCDSKFAGLDEVNFSIEKTEIEDIQVQANTYYVSKGKIVSQEDRFLVVQEANYAVDDILMVPTDYNGTSNYAAGKVKHVENISNGMQAIEMGNATLEEVYSNLNINKTYEIGEEQTDYYSEAEIEQYAMESVAVKNVRAVTGKPPKISFKIKNYNPFKYELTVKFADVTISNIPKFDLEFKFAGTIEVSNYSDIHIAYQNVSTTTRHEKETSISITFSAENIADQLKKKDSFLKNSNTNFADSKFIKESQNVKDFKNADTSEYEIEQKALYEKKQAALNELVKVAKGRYNKEPSIWEGELPLFKIYYMIVPGVAIGGDIDFYYNMSLEADVEVENFSTQTTEVGCITKDGSQEEYRNCKSTSKTSLTVSGSFAAEAGIQLKVYFDIAFIVQIGIKAQIGGYFEFSGTCSLVLENTNIDITENPYSHKIDVGIKMGISLYCKFNELFGGATFEVTPLTKKISLTESKNKTPIPEGGSNQKTYIQDIVLGNSSIRNNCIDPESGIAIDATQPNYFVFAKGAGTMSAPAFSKRTMTLDAQELRYTDLNYSDIILQENDYVYYDAKDNLIKMKDASMETFRVPVAVFLKDDTGRIDPNSFAVVIFEKKPIDVTSISLYSDMQENGHPAVFINDNTKINSIINPLEATYQAMNYSIIGIKRGNEDLSNLGNCATVDNYGLLCTTATVSVGDVIKVQAVSVSCPTVKGVIDIIVAKKSVEKVTIFTEPSRADIKPGETIPLHFSIAPLNATNQDIVLNFMVGSQYAHFIKNAEGSFLVANSNAPVGAIIKICATADGVESGLYSFTVGAIPATSIILCDDEENFLDEQTTIYRGQSFKLGYYVIPEDSTVGAAKYTIVSGADIAVISDDSLYIKRQATLGGVVQIITSVNGIQSSVYSFVVANPPITKVELNKPVDSQTDTFVQPGTHFQFFAHTFPEEGVYNIKYRICKGNDYAEINDNGVLYVSNMAPVNSWIEVQAYTKTITGTEVRSTVEGVHVSQPKIKYIDIDANGISILNSGSSYQLSYNMFPINAGQLGFKITFGTKYATVQNDGKILVNESIDGINAEFGVVAYSITNEPKNSVKSNELRFRVKVRIKEVQIEQEQYNIDNTTTEIGTIHIGLSAKFKAMVSPSNAVGNNVEFIITNGKGFASIDRATGYLVANKNAPVGEKIGVAVIVDGVRSDEIFVEIVGNTIEQVILDENREINVAAGGKYTFSPIVLPQHAVASNMIYDISVGKSLASITDGCLYVASDAQAGSIIEVYVNVVTNGTICSDTITINVIAASISTITLSSSKNQLSLGEQVSLMSSSNQATFRIISGKEYCEITSAGYLSIKENSLYPQNSPIIVVANAYGTESNAVTIYLKKTVDNVTINASLLEAFAGDEINLFGYTNVSSDDDIAYSILSGGEFIQVGSSGSVINNNKILIKQLLNSGGEIKIQGSCAGVTSNVLTVYILKDVEQILLSFANDKTTLNVGEADYINVSILPEGESNRAISFFMLDEYAGVFLNVDSGYLSVDRNATIGQTIRIQARSGGVTSNILEIVTTPETVTDIKINTYGLKSVAQNGMLTLGAKVTPNDARGAVVSYSIMSGTDFAVITSDNKLKVNSDAPVGTVIRIKAMINQLFDMTDIVVTQNYPLNVHIHTGGVNTVHSGDKLYVFNYIVNHITDEEILGKVELFVIEGQENATIDENGFLKINDVIDAEHCDIVIVGMFNGTYSNIHHVKIVQPLSCVKISASKYELNPSESVSINLSINAENYNKIDFFFIAGSEIASLNNNVLSILNNTANSDGYIKIQAVVDGVYSNILIFKIVVKVESVTISSPYSIQPGGCVQLLGTVNPVNATEKDISYEIVGSVYGITINSKTGQLTATNSAPVGQIIQVMAHAGDKNSNTTVTICKIPVTSVSVDVSNNFQVAAGAKFVPNVNIFPSNATYQNYQIVITQGTAYVDVFGKEIYVHADAPIGNKINFYILADGNESGSYSFSIGNAVKQIILSAAGVREISLGDRLQINVFFYPENAVTGTLSYTISNTTLGTISNGGLLEIYDNNLSAINQIIYVYASIDNVVSEPYELKIVKRPVTSFAVTNLLSQIEPGEVWVPTLAVTPINATITAFSLRIIKGSQYCSVNNNVLYINNSISTGNAIITVSIQCDDISETFNISIYVPVSTIILNVPDTLLMGETVNLSATCNVNATNPTVQYKIVVGYEYIENVVPLAVDNIGNIIYVVTGNKLVIKSDIQTQSPKITIIGFADETESILIERIITIPVEGIDITLNTLNVVPGNSYSVVITFNPYFASNKNYDITIFPSNSAKYNKNNNMFTVSANAEPGSDIYILAKSKYNTAITCTKSLVVDVVYANDIENVFIMRKNNGLMSGPITENNKALPGDRLTFVADYSPSYTTYKDYTITLMSGDVDCVIRSNDDRELTVKTQLMVDNPVIYIRYNYTDGNENILSKMVTLYIYVPVRKIDIVDGGPIDRGHEGLFRIILNDGMGVSDRNYTINITKITFPSGSSVASNFATYGHIVDHQRLIDRYGLYVEQNVNGGTIYDLRVAHPDYGSRSIKASVKNIDTYRVLFSNDNEFVIKNGSPELRNGKSTTLSVQALVAESYFNTTICGIKVFYQLSNDTVGGATIDSRGNLTFPTTGDGKGSVVVTVICIDLDGTNVNSASTINRKTLVITVKCFKPVTTTASIFAATTNLSSLSNSANITSLGTSKTTYTHEDLVYSVSSGNYYSINSSTGVLSVSNAANASDAVVINATLTQYYNGKKYGTTIVISRTYNRRFISTANQLKNISMTGNWWLINSIDLQNQSWTPLGEYTEFSGNFYGNNYSIKNLKINVSTANYRYGLFANNSGNINSVILDGFTINNSYTSYSNQQLTLVGALVGYNWGTIKNCKALNGTINMSDPYSHVGTFVGQNNGGTIYSCDVMSDNVTIRGSGWIGGIVGTNSEDGTIDFSWFTGKLYYSYREINRGMGGILGYNAGVVTNCQFRGYWEWVCTERNEDIKPHIGHIVGKNTGTQTSNTVASTASYKLQCEKKTFIWVIWDQAVNVMKVDDGKVGRNG